jgi:parvulin-like peptidyl-prolyl isomerase
MKKIATIFLSATLLSSIAFADSDKIIASYKGGDVKESQIMDMLRPSLQSQPGGKDKKFSDFDRTTQEALIHGYIQLKLLDQEIKNSDIESSAEVQKALAASKENIVREAFVERQVKSAIDQKNIDAKYSELVNSLKGKDEVKVSHILFENSPEGEKKAKEAKKRLNKGEKFATLAKESKDEGSKANGGEIGYIRQGQLVPEFEEKALSMKVNEVSDPVKTQFGYHIIKVLDKRPIKIPSLDEVKNNIITKLKTEAIQKYMSDLESKADLKIMLSQPTEANDQKDTKKDKK